MKAAWHRERLRRAVVYAVSFTMACVVLQYAPRWFGNLVAEDITFTATGPASWSADLRGLRPQTYFVSAGRPRAACDLRLDGRLLASNASTDTPYRDRLMLGATFEATARTRAVTVECLAQKGFPAGLTGAPIISGRTEGQLLHLWRAITQIALGPLVAACLFLYLIISLLVSSQELRTESAQMGAEEKRRQWQLAAFAIASLVYGTSLSHLTYLFLTPESGAVVHIFLRSLYAMGLFTFLAYSRSGRGVTVVAIHAVQVGGVVVVAIVWPELLQRYYTASFAFFVVSAAIAAFLLMRSQGTRTNTVLFGAAASWAVLQPLDYWASFVLYWENLSPSMLTVLCVSLVYVDLYERMLVRRAQTVSSSLLATIHTTAPLEVMIGTVAATTREATRFDRFSTYVDRNLFSQGTDETGSYERVADHGYGRFPETFRTVGKQWGSGLRMRRAMRLDKPVSARGLRDKGWYVVLPLGGLGCINLSDTRPISWYDYSERSEFMRKLGPTFQALRTRTFERAAVLRRGRVEKELEGVRAFSLTASRVTHDIRSPLTALTVLAENGANIEEGSRKALFDGAVERIHQIANDLLNETKAPRDIGAGSRSAVAEPQNLAALARACSAVVEEMRLKHRARTGLQLQFEAPTIDAYEASARLSVNDLQRVISNLLENAADAIEDDGSIALSLSVSDEGIGISVTDSGCGIPDELIERLGTKGLTFGKPNGNGLGLHSAKEFATGAGGKLQIRSVLGRGTKVTLSLPNSAPSGT